MQSNLSKQSKNSAIPLSFVVLLPEQSRSKQKEKKNTHGITWNVQYSTVLTGLLRSAKPDSKKLESPDSKSWKVRIQKNWNNVYIGIMQSSTVFLQERNPSKIEENSPLKAWGSPKCYFRHFSTNFHSVFLYASVL